MTTMTRERARAATAPRPTFRLRRRAHKAALSAHILTSVGWFGIAVGVAFCGVAAATSPDPALVVALQRVLAASLWLSIPTGLLAVASGSLLSLGTSFGFVRHWWVVAKIGLSVAVIATDAVVIRASASHAVTTGHTGRPLAHGTVAHVLVLGLATVLSVWKPRGRTPWGRRSGTTTGR